MSQNNVARARRRRRRDFLRDGRSLRLRPPRREDADALVAFFEGLSERSRYLRFHGYSRLGPQLVEPVLDPDWDETGALLGTVADDAAANRSSRSGTTCGCATGAVAEAAFAVADAHQRRGIGTRLLEQLASRAAGQGIERFVAEVMPDNREMVGVFEAVGFELSRELESGELEVEFPIAATQRYAASVAERDHTAVTASLRPFFEPHSVAVVGASRRRGNIGGELFRNILSGDFAGAAYPVNRDGDPVAGVRGYRSIEDCPRSSTSPSSRSPAPRSSQRRSRRSAPASARSSSSRPDSPRSAARGRAPGAAARARARPRSPADRPQLPRHRGCRAPA